MVVLFLTLAQCQKDDVLTQEETSTKTQDVISRKIPFQNSPHFQIINPKISNLNTSLNAVSENQRSIYTDSILILTDEVLYITYANTHTYTFKLLRENPEYYIENIVLHYNTDTQNYDEYLLQYDVSEDEFIDIANGGALSENANTYISKLDNGTFSNNLSRVSCSYSCQTISIPCTGEQHHPFGDTNCPLLGTPGAATQIQACGTSCIVIDDPSFDPSNPPIETGSGGSSVITNPYSLESCTLANGNQGFIGLNGTCSKPRNIEQRIEDCLGSNAPSIQNLNYETKQLIDSFLELNQCNSLSRSFIIDSIETLENGGSIDIPNAIILDETFQNNLKVKCIYDKLKALSNTIFKDIIDGSFGSSNTNHVKISIGSIPSQIGANSVAYTHTTYDSNNTHPLFSGDIKNIVIDPNFIQNSSSIQIATVLIHEFIHAELIDRCIKLGLVKAQNSLGGTVFNSNPTNHIYIQAQIFNILMVQYNAYHPPSGNFQWQHDLFNGLSYRTEIVQNLITVHPSLNDTSYDFLNNVNNDPSIVGGPYNLDQLMEYISWIGLEGTQDFASNISSIPNELAKKDYVEGAANTKYTHNCNY